MQVGGTPDHQQVGDRHTIRCCLVDRDDVDVEMCSEALRYVVRDNVGVSVDRLVDDECSHEMSMAGPWTAQ